MKQRSRTLIEHLGFNDSDLKSPAHDAMVLWIADHVREYVEKDFDPWRGVAQAAKDAEDAIEAELKGLQYDLARGVQDLKSKIESVKKLMPPARVPRPAQAPQVDIETQFEKAISTDRDYIVGFVDVVSMVEYPKVYAANLRFSEHYGGERKIVGYKEKPPELGFTVHCEDFYFEAKPKIRSMGELLRQIRTYQEYVKGRFVVVSPDVRFRAAIESQKVEFWESPSF